MEFNDAASVCHIIIHLDQCLWKANSSENCLSCVNYFTIAQQVSTGNVQSCKCCLYFFEILYSFQDDYTLMEEFIYMLSVRSPHSQTYIPYSHQPIRKLVRNLIIQYFSLSFLVVPEASIIFPHVLPLTFNFSKIWTVYDPFLWKNLRECFWVI